MAAVDLAIVRVDQEMARGNRTHDVLRQSHLIEALRWHLLCSTHGEPMIHRCARTNHQLRAEQGTRLCGTCERWETDPATRACSSTNCGLQARKAA